MKTHENRVYVYVFASIFMLMILCWPYVLDKACLNAVQKNDHKKFVW